MSPSHGGGGGVENYSLCTSTQQYVYDQKVSKSICLTVFKLQGGTDRQNDKANHIGFLANRKNTNITPK